jgi:hypothetical protein
MENIDRRTFLRATTAIAAGAVAPQLTLATDNNRELMASPTPITPDVTKILASYIISARYEDLPANVRKEGQRLCGPRSRHRCAPHPSGARCRSRSQAGASRDEHNS